MKKILFTLLIFSWLPAFAQVNLSSGLVAYYPFNGNFSDASGSGNHGIAKNGVGFGTDQWGTLNSAAQFDGVDDYIAIPGSRSITASRRFSIALRFFTNVASFQVLLSKSNWSNGAPDSFQYQAGFNAGSVLPSNNLYFASSHKASCLGPNGLASHYSYGNSISPGQWYCLVLSFDEGVKKIYMNGSLISTATVSGTPLNNAVDSCAGGELRIGAWWQGDPLWFRGLIDEMRVYDRTLSALEVDSLCKLRPQSETILNQYAAIQSRVPDCSNSFRVDDASGFRAGDTVLMIQMQGAVIDTTNSETFGQLLDMNGAGNYEYNRVQAVTGNVITLRSQLLKYYDIANGRVQLVRVPSFPAYTVTQPHTCSPWNGSKGGVFAIRVAGTLTLNASISVSGAGFRGGQPLLSAQASCNKTDYFYPPTRNEGGQKGEGIALVSTSKQYGRGRLANGGGGGNDNNAGGGGGGTFGNGGTGGQQYNVGACATNLNIGGVGGTVSTTARGGRLLMGGGGGAGHGNEKGEKAGGAGGGILILDVGAINSNAQQPVSANGADAPQCSAAGNPGGGCMNDGGGGGGGGGQVLITATSISGTLPISAKGGKGSDVYLGNGVTPSGPGGGGGGGHIAAVASTSARTTQNISGGANGTLPQLGTAYGAQAGSAGQSLSSSAIPVATAPFVSTAVKPAFRDSISGCLSRQLFNTTITPVPGPTQASWSIPGVGTSSVQNPVFTFPAYGSYEVTLWVTDANGCRDSIQRIITVSEPVGSARDTTFCANGALMLSGRPGIAYAWIPSQNLSSPSTQTVMITDVGKHDSAQRSYRVTTTIAPGCSVTDTFNVTIRPAPYAEFSFRPNPPQANKPVAFMTASRYDSSLAWSFGDGSVSPEANPSHLFMETRSFEVCLVAMNTTGCTDTACQDIAAEYRLTVAVATGFSPNGDGHNDVLTVKGGPFASMKFAVFNRWGQTVFQTTNPTQGWDGSYRGAPQPVDVYTYVVSVSYTNGNTETIKGNVTLIR